MTYKTFKHSIMNNKILVIFAVIFLMTSCSKYKKYDVLGMFTSVSPSSNERFAKSMDYNKSHGYDHIYVDQDDYRLYVITDTHIDTTTRNLDIFVDAYLGDTATVPFALHLGDLINAEGYWSRYADHIKPIEDAGRKLYHVAGNHDLYYNQWKEFVARYNTSSYWFDVTTPAGFRDLYIGLDSGNGTLGTDQREWLGNLLNDMSLRGYRNIIAFTHTNIFKKDTSQGHTSNFPMEETYDLTDLFAKYGVDMVLQGHSHYRDITVFKDVSYLRLDAIEDTADEAYYTILKVGNNINYEFIRVK